MFALYVVLLIFAVLFLLKTRFSTPLIHERNGVLVKSPPKLSGLIPWLGYALSYRNSPPKLLKSLSTRHGPVFSIKLAGTNITFISARSLISTLLRNTQRSVSNEEIQLSVLCRVCGITAIEETRAIIYHGLYPIVDRNLTNATVEATTTDCPSARKNDMLSWLTEGGGTSGKHYLSDLTYSIMWHVMTTSLVGKGFPAGEFTEDFRKFEENAIVLASPLQIPSFMNPVLKARERFMEKLGQFILKKEADDYSDISKVMTESFHLIRRSGLDYLSCARIFTGFLMAIQGNSARTALWLIAYLLQDKSKHEELRVGVDEFVENICGGDVGNVNSKTLSQLDYPLLDSCIYETMRLVGQSSSIRVADEDFTLTDNRGLSFAISKGTTIMPSTEAAHYDEDKYSDPYAFNMDRFVSPHDPKSLKMDNNGQTSITNLFVWGGGKHVCKGRFVALHELRAFLVSFVYLFDVEVLGVGKRGAVKPGYHVPKFDYNGIGTVLPKEEILVELKRRK